MPKGVKWIKQKAVSLAAEQNSVTLDNQETINYEYLIVAPGIQLNWGAVKGLEQTIGKNNVCFNYSFKYAPYTFECIENFKCGNALFTNPNTPVKCGGAPHKIMYLATDYFRKHGILDKANIQYWSGGTRLFAEEKYEKTLFKVIERGNIKMNFFFRLDEIDGPNKKAKFVGFGEKNKDEEHWVEFDIYT